MPMKAALLAAMLVGMWAAPARAGPAPDVTDITLEIEQYAWLNVPFPLYLLVRTGYFGSDKLVFDHTRVEATLNFNGYLWCPQEAEVSHTEHGEYTLDCAISLESANPANEEQVNGVWYWVLPLDAGEYDGDGAKRITLGASIKKLWGPEDRAGEYEGTVTLSLLSQGQKPTP